MKEHTNDEICFGSAANLNMITNHYMAALLSIFCVLFLCNTMLNAQVASWKSLREEAQVRNVEIPERDSESEREQNLDSLVFAQTIIVGKIDVRNTRFDGKHHLRTDYTVSVQSIVKDFKSVIPIEIYPLLPKDYFPPPSALSETITIARYGGSMNVNGNRIIQKVPGYNQLNEGDTYIFFLSWEPNYNAFMLHGGISGAILIGANSQIIPLTTKGEFRSEYLKTNQFFNGFLEDLKKVKSLCP